MNVVDLWKSLSHLLRIFGNVANELLVDEGSHPHGYDGDGLVAQRLDGPRDSTGVQRRHTVGDNDDRVVGVISVSGRLGVDLLGDVLEAEGGVRSTGRIVESVHLVYQLRLIVYSEERYTDRHQDAGRTREGKRERKKKKGKERVRKKGE